MAETLYADPTTFRASGGKLNSARRYIQRVPLSPVFYLAGGPTMHVTLSQGYGATYIAPGIRYSVAGFVWQGISYSNNGSGAFDFSFNAAVIGVGL